MCHRAVASLHRQWVGRRSTLSVPRTNFWLKGKKV
jgi:hypothetical protein